MTGLFNRRVFERILDREVSRAKRYNSALSLIFIDFDDFKTINDTAGHSIGDKALCFLGDALNSNVPAQSRKKATLIQKLFSGYRHGPLGRKIGSFLIIMAFSTGLY